MPAAMMSEMQLVQSSTLAKMPSRVRYASGLRVSRTHAFVTSPKVPSLPTMVPVRSYPGPSSHGPPTTTTFPSGITISTPRMWFTVTPYLSVCGPPLFVATFPPMVHAPWLLGSGA